ncbi:MAG: SPOR domain-containing protein [Pseudomonadota bacterium]|nr:SPOR domain-containing protein [Pseudomonadota bacterium]
MTRAARQPQLRQTPPRKTRLFVQAGAFANAANADKLRQRLEAFGRVSVSPAVINGKRFYRVRIGPLSGVGTGDQVLARVIDFGYPGARLVVD